MDHAVKHVHGLLRQERHSAVTHWLYSQAGDFCDMGIQNLIQRYDKCNNSGDCDVQKELIDRFIIDNKSSQVIAFCFFLLALENLFSGWPDNKIFENVIFTSYT